MNCDDLKNGIKSLEDVQGSLEKKVDKAFTKGADILRKIPGSDKYLIATKEQEKVADMISSFNNAQANIYKSSSDIAKYLHTLSKDESKALVRALNGDIMPETLQGETKELYKRFRAVIDSNAQKLVDAGLLRADYKKEDYLKRFYEKYQDDLVWSDKLFGKARNLSKVYKRKDLDLDTRVALGMIEDSSFVISRTIADQRLQLIKGEFLKSVDKMYGKKESLDGYIKVPDENIGGGLKKYGALSGKYVPRDIASILKGANIVRNELGVLEKYVYPVVDHIKVNVTVKNPVTHLYNVGSNLQISYLQGSLGETARLIKLSKVNPKEFAKLVDEVREFGFDSMLKDMQELELVANADKKVNIAKTIIKNLYLTQDSKAGSIARTSYDWEDKIFKLGAYQKAKKAYEKSLKRKLTPEELKKIYKEAVAPYADYSTPLPAAWKVLDKSGAMPFIHYLYKSTPAVTKLILKHPLKYTAMQTAILASGASIFNKDDDALKPEWAGNKSRVNLYGAKEWTEFGNTGWYLNAGRMIPGMRFGAMSIDMGFIGATSSILQGKTPLGYNINNKYDSTAEKIFKQIFAAAENYAPPLTFGRYGQRAVKKLAGFEQKNYYNEDLSWGEFIGRAGGVRKFNNKKEVQKRLKDAKNKLNYQLKNDPKNAHKHRLEYEKTIKEVQKQARAKGIHADVTRRKTKKMFDVGF